MERAEKNEAKRGVPVKCLLHNTNYHLCVCVSVLDVCMVVLYILCIRVYMLTTYSCQYWWRVVFLTADTVPSLGTVPRQIIDITWFCCRVHARPLLCAVKVVQYECQLCSETGCALTLLSNQCWDYVNHLLCLWRISVIRVIYRHLEILKFKLIGLPETAMFHHPIKKSL